MPGAGATLDTCGCDGWFARKFGDLPMMRLRLSLRRLMAPFDRLLARRDVDDLQSYRLGSSLPHYLNQRLVAIDGCTWHHIYCDRRQARSVRTERALRSPEQLRAGRPVNVTPVVTPTFIRQ